MLYHFAHYRADAEFSQKSEFAILSFASLVTLVVVVYMSMAFIERIPVYVPVGKSV